MRLLQTIPKVFFFTILSFWLAACGGSGSGSGDDSIKLLGVSNAINYPLPSETYADEVYFLGEVHISHPDDEENFARQVTVTWRNDATGQSGSEQLNFSYSCVHFLGPGICGYDGNYFDVVFQLEFGMNQITITATMEGTTKTSKYTVERLYPLPESETLPATNIGSFEAKLGGTVNPRGDNTDTWFEYSTDPGIISQNSTPIKNRGSGSADLFVSETVQNLLGGIPYFYRLVARNSYGTVPGGIQSFSTPIPIAPVITTFEATNIIATTTTISGSIEANSQTASAWLEWGTDNTLTTNTTSTPVIIPFGSPTTTLEEDLTGLDVGTEYFFRITAMNSTGTSPGDILNFTTHKPASAITSPAMQLFPRESTVSGSANPNGYDANAWFELGFDPDFVAYTVTSPTHPLGSGVDFLPIDHLFDQLVPGTEYYYRAQASNMWGIGQGEVLGFTTPLAGDTCWAKKYHAIIGSELQVLDKIGSIDQTSDGGYIVLGERLGSGPPSQTGRLVMKTNSEGGVEWSFDYEIDTNHGEVPRFGKIKEIEPDRYIESGSIISGGIQRQWIAERDADGNIIWQKAYESLSKPPPLTSVVLIKDIEVLSDGFIVLGQLMIVKLDTSGNIEWQYKYDGIGNGEISDITVVSDGYILVGNTDSFGAGSYDVLVIKLDQDGNVLWNYAYGTTEAESGRAVTKTLNGVAIAAQAAEGKGIWVLDLLDDGSINWQTTYGRLPYCGEDITGILSTSDGGLLVSGMEGVRYNAGCPIRVRLLKLDNLGSIQWQKEYPDFGLIGINLVQEIPGSGYIIGADAHSTGYPYYDMALIKTGIDGSCSPLDTDITTTPNVTSVAPISGSMTRSTSDLIALPANIQNIPTYVAIEEITP